MGRAGSLAGCCLFDLRGCLTGYGCVRCADAGCGCEGGSRRRWSDSRRLAGLHAGVRQGDSSADKAARTRHRKQLQCRLQSRKWSLELRGGRWRQVGRKAGCQPPLRTRLIQGSLTEEVQFGSLRRRSCQDEWRAWLSSSLGRVRRTLHSPWKCAGTCFETTRVCDQCRVSLSARQTCFEGPKSRAGNQTQSCSLWQYEARSVNRPCWRLESR